MLYFPTLISIIEVILVIVPVLLTVAFVTVAERKTMASMQRRLASNFIGHITKVFAFNMGMDIPKPYLFTTERFEANMDIFQIVTEINTLLPQLSDFINQFNSLVNQSGISVITDSVGNMTLDVPQNMPDSVANNLNTRIGIIDRLITTRGQEINDLLQKGLNVENNIKAHNPNYTSQLTEKIAEFRRLNASYKH